MVFYHSADYSLNDRRFQMFRRITSFPLLVCTAVALSTTWATSHALAITFGEVDATNRFSNVGAIVAVQDSSVVGSGILIHPRILLTAGHITDNIEFLIENGLATHDDGRVSFGVDATDPSTWHEIE